MRLVWLLLDSVIGRSLLNRIANYRLTNLTIKQLICSKGKILSPRARSVIQEALPNKSVKINEEDLQVAIVTREKDSKYLEICIASIKMTHPELSRNIHVICPDEDFTSLRYRIDDDVVIHTDSEFLDLEIQRELLRFDVERRGWIRQQILKFNFTVMSDAFATLLVDSDTLILDHQNWADKNGVQLLAISDEYHEPYDLQSYKFFETFFKQKPKRMRVSFVTHHQVMQKRILKVMFNADESGNCSAGLLSWMRSINQKHLSGACEWHTYGSYILQTEPKNVVLYRWLNSAVPPEKFDGMTSLRHKRSVSEIRELFPKLNSISLHHYLR